MLAAVLGPILIGQAHAQTFTTLHSFSASTTGTGTIINSDGASPQAGLVLLGGTLYGTSVLGGGADSGTVFKVDTNGTGFVTLHDFSAYDTTSVNSDGAAPNANLVLSGGTLYGTARHGVVASGTVFAINVDGTGFTNLYYFTGGSDGNNPNSALILSGNTLYGTTFSGGDGYGTVFALTTDGASFNTLYTFTGGNDGSGPFCRLVLSGSTLYGTTSSGGGLGSGTVFALGTDGSNFKTLYTFTAVDPTSKTNSDGASPKGSFALDGDTVYGTSAAGGSSAAGTVFALKTDGTAFRTLYSLNGTTDGAIPLGGLILSSDTLYGTTGGGGGFGTAFSIRTDGTAFAVLHRFSPGVGSHADLTLSDKTLYGTTSDGGNSGNGTVFSISLPSITPPQLNITPAAANFILTWPTGAGGFTLQSTTNLASPVWSTNLPAPILVNGQNTVTNPISGTRQFFRLSQ